MHRHRERASRCLLDALGLALQGAQPRVSEWYSSGDCPNINLLPWRGQRLQQLRYRFLTHTAIVTSLLAASTLTLGVLRPGVAVDAELSSLAEQGQARVLAKPKILTLDQSPASIQSGVQIPYQETSRSGATSTSFRNAVLSLHVLPQITPDQNIMMQLRVKQDAVGQIFNGVPSINTNEIQTSVLVGNGETLVLGGILQEDANSSERKTPILSDIPFFGKAFRRKIERQTSRSF